MRRIREDAGIKKTKMAKFIGISSQALWAIEAGRSAPSNATVEKFCNVMEIPQGFLYLKSLDGKDFIALNGADSRDVRDIIELAILRTKRSIERYNGNDAEDYGII